MRHKRNKLMEPRERETTAIPAWEDLTPAEQWEVRLAPFTLLGFIFLLYMLFGGN